MGAALMGRTRLSALSKRGRLLYSFMKAMI